MYTITSMDGTEERFARSAAGLASMVDEIHDLGKPVRVGLMDVEYIRYDSMVSNEGVTLEYIIAKCVCGSEHCERGYFCFASGVMLPGSSDESGLKSLHDWFEASVVATRDIIANPDQSQEEAEAKALAHLKLLKILA